MIVFIQYPNQERQHFVVNEFDDLKPIFDQFPSAHEIAISSDSLKEAVDGIVDYISSGQLEAWVDDGQLAKSLKSKALALGLSLSLSTALQPSMSAVRTPQVHPAIASATIAKPVDPNAFGTHPLDRFLWNVKQIESSGGKNTNHKPIKQGRFKGERAMGKWGLLKPTVDEIVNRMKLSGDMPQQYSKLSSMSRDVLDAHLKQNPHIELGLVRKLAEHVIKRQKGNEHKAAYAWLHGHNLFSGAIQKDHLANSDYVAKYKTFNDINPLAQKKRDVSSIQLGLLKQQTKIDSSDFKMNLKNWYKERHETTPTRDHTFVPDMGRIREEELDAIKPASLMSPEEKLKYNVAQVNKKR